MSSRHTKALRVGLAYYGKIVQDRTFKNTPGVSVGQDNKNTFIVPVIGINEGFQVFSRAGGDGYTLKVTDKLDGRLNIGGKNYYLADLLKTDLARESGKAKVETADGGTEQATVYTIEVKPDDWGMLRFGNVELLFQFSLPPAAIASASTLGSGAIAGIVGGALSLLGVATLLSFLVLGGFLYYAQITWRASLEELKDQEEDDQSVQFNADAEEEEDKELEPEEEPLPEEVEEIAYIEEAPKAAEDEEGKFGEEDLTEETQLTDIEADERTSVDASEVGVQAALGSNMLGEGGVQSLLGGGADVFGDALDQVNMVGDDGTYRAGFGFGGMGNAGRGVGGGGGPGGGTVGRFHGDGGGRGRGRGGQPAAQRREVQVRPQVTLSTPTQSGFCKPDDIKQAVQRKAGSFRNCYERQLIANPDLTGKIVLQWKIQLDGSATDPRVSSSTMNNDQVERCMTRVVNRLRFNKPDGGICVVEFPFTFVSGQ